MINDEGFYTLVLYRRTSWFSVFNYFPCLIKCNYLYKEKNCFLKEPSVKIFCRIICSIWRTNSCDEKNIFPSICNHSNLTHVSLVQNWSTNPVHVNGLCCLLMKKKNGVIFFTWFKFCLRFITFNNGTEGVNLYLSVSFKSIFCEIRLDKWAKWFTVLLNYPFPFTGITCLTLFGKWAI